MENKAIMTAIETILNSDEFIIIARKDLNLTVAFSEEQATGLIVHFLGNEPAIAKAFMEQVEAYKVVKEVLQDINNEGETKTDNPLI